MSGHVILDVYMHFVFSLKVLVVDHFSYKAPGSLFLYLAIRHNLNIRETL